MEKRRVRLLEHDSWIERDVQIPDRHPYDTDYEGRISAYLNGIYGPGKWKPLFETEASQTAESALRAVRRNLGAHGFSAESGLNLFKQLNTRSRRTHRNKYPKH